jgi:hypothetical protein
MRRLVRVTFDAYNVQPRRRRTPPARHPYVGVLANADVVPLALITKTPLCGPRPHSIAILVVI